MPSSDFSKADIDEIIDKLSTEEAVKLIAGVGRWYTAAIERLNIPAIKVRSYRVGVFMSFNRKQVTNGPNGARGFLVDHSGTHRPIDVRA